jgi:hypothetical protein
LYWQVEELNDANGFWAVNTVYLALVWCTVAMMASVFVSGIHTSQGWRGFGVGVLYFMSCVPPVIVVIVLAITGGQAGCGIASGVICCSVGLAIFVMNFFRENKDSGGVPDNEGQAVRNASVTSACYAVGAWAAWASFNAAAQRRDYMYTMASGGLVVVMAFLSYSVR